MGSGTKIIAALIVSMVLVGCKSVTDLYGEGPITMTPRINAAFEKYKLGPGPEYFAVSQDGRTYGWSYCVAGIDSCRGGGLPGMIAIKACERGSNGVPCKIYARSNWVVWKGPVKGGAGTNSALGYKSDDVVCGYAVDYSGDQPKWTAVNDHKKYVKEAKLRNFTLEQCDAMN